MNVIRSVACACSLWLLLCAGARAADGQPADSPLADAAEKQDAPAIARLLEQKSDASAPQADGMTALHWAALHDDVELVRRLIAAGADAKAKNRYGVTPLALACTAGNGPIVEALLAAGADPNGSIAGGETALMTAARTGRLEAVAALIARGADVNAREVKGQTALMWAAAEGNVAAVDALVKAGADFRTPLPSGFTPFFFAVREGRTAAVLRLLESGVDVNDAMQREHSGGPAKKTTSGLLLAVENGHFELAAALLKAGADPNDAPAGYSALHAMTWVRKPLRGDGNPPPLGSGRIGSFELLERLVARGADVNARIVDGKTIRGFTTSGATPFLLAAQTSDVEYMKLLLAHGADARLANADDCPPLLVAAGVGPLDDGEESAGTDDEALETCRLLLELGADVNAVDKNGETVMHGAAYQSRAALIQFFAEHGADVKAWNHKNRFGWTPLEIAQGNRPGNFRPDSPSIAAVQRLLRPADAGSQP